MAKKEKLELQRSEDFTSLEAELTAALQNLDNASERVEVLLQEYAPAAPPVADAEEGSDGEEPETGAPPQTP